MNSVISAFKGKKNASNNSSSNNASTSFINATSNAVSDAIAGSSSNNVSTSDVSKSNGHHYSHLYSHHHNVKKKAINSQDNGYQYLRHIREIDPANKLLSPVAVTDDMFEGGMLGYRAPQPPMYNNVPTVVACVDVVDHAEVVEPFNVTHLTPLQLSAKTGIGTDCNMNGEKSLPSNSVLQPVENGNCSEVSLSYETTNRKCIGDVASNILASPPNQTKQHSIMDGDYDESEHSTVACTSSSNDHSNSTVVQSPTTANNTANTATKSLVTTTATQLNNQQPQIQKPSPAKSLSLSLNSNASSVSPSKSVSSLKSSSSSSLTPSSSLALSPSASSASTGAVICNSGPSSCSSSTSCNLTTIAGASNISSSSPTPSSHSANNTNSTCGTATPPSQSSSPTPIVNAGNAADYVPAFLKMTPITLPIKMPTGKNFLASVPPMQNRQPQQLFMNNYSENCSSSKDIHPNPSSAATTPKHSRYSKPRLSLSRFINHSMPSVHGRPNLSIPANSGDNSDCGTLANPPKRISTHQRNLSLDFRSMGILLPPISQLTNTRINLTQHHRNRSLDSALQRIPEVEVSSPNAENENTFCTPSIRTTMCSKIVTTAANVTAALTTTTTPALTIPSSSPLSISSQIKNVSTTAAGATEKHTAEHSSSPLISPNSNTMLSSLATVLQPTLKAGSAKQANAPNPEVFVENCAAFKTRPKSGDITTINSRCPGATTDGSISINAHNNSNKINNSNSNGNNGVNKNSKKREDLTSLGSDDSGIICGSDSDQIFLNRVCNSHESLDSGEMDAEEECIDMLETTSMDEEYGMLQSDLCFYQTSDIDCRTLRPSRKSKQKQQKHQQQQQRKDNDEASGSSLTSCEVGGAGDGKTTPDLNERTRYREMNMCQAALHIERSSRCSTPTPTNTSKVDVVDTACSSKVSLATKPVNTLGGVQAPIITTPAPSVVSGASAAPSAPASSLKPQKSNDASTESTKNDVLFKNFFGATKNAIFRTAQSIIENHEKKNAAKNKTEDANAANGGATTPQDQIKSPVDISKKKEFFGLITSNSSKRAAAAAAAAAAIAAANSSTLTPKIDSPEQVENLERAAASADLNSSPLELTEHTLNLNLSGGFAPSTSAASMSQSSSISSLNKLKVVPGVVKCFIKERPGASETQHKTEKGPNGLLRFFESPVFNIHFAVHYLFYSKEPGVLSFIGNKIFNFPDHEVDLYIPQLIVMYIQMDELAEVLDPYLTIRCRKSVDFSLKCLWLLEAYNYQVDSLGSTGRKSQLALMKEIFSKKERKVLSGTSKPESKEAPTTMLTTPTPAIPKKTHHRSQSDATVLLTGSLRYPTANTLSLSNQPAYLNQLLPPTTTIARLCLGDLTSGRAFDNGCTCFESVRGQVNGLLGQKTVCNCGAPKTAPEKEFMKALINVGKNLTSLPSKAEKTSALRMFLNLINKNLPARVWLPLYSDIPHHVVRITEEKTAVLNSKDKTPYIIYVEVVEVSDIYSSPLIPKMMPSLRHTKSEEYLEGVGGSAASHTVCSRTSSCSSHGGSRSGSGSASGGASKRKEKLISESSSSVASESGAGNPTANDVQSYNNQAPISFGGLNLNEDNVWSQEDDDITAQYMNLRKIRERDAISQMSLDSCDSRDQGLPVLFNIGDVRTRHCNNLSCENTKSFSNDPEDPSAAALKEPWHEKEKQIRESSPYGHLSNWRLLSAIVKCGDDLRQELMATQLLEMFKIIWQEENVDLWVRPYKIVCLSNDSGLIEPILNTVSLHQIKKNSNKSLRDYFIDEYGDPDSEQFCLAQKNFVQSCAAYCLISYLLQVKDRHNGNILLHSDGHIIHIDFGFILSISPKNLGFEQSPFKLTHEFVEVMGGTSSDHWKDFNRLLLVGMMSARKHMDRIINFVEIMRSNAQLPCFKNGCSGTVQNLRKRFHMNLTEQEMERKVEQLVQDSLKSLSTKLYDGYQYYTNGIL